MLSFSHRYHRVVGTLTVLVQVRLKRLSTVLGYPRMGWRNHLVFPCQLLMQSGVALDCSHRYHRVVGTWTMLEQVHLMHPSIVSGYPRMGWRNHVVFPCQLLM
jgi:hypothetical protein